MLGKDIILMKQPYIYMYRLIVTGLGDIPTLGNSRCAQIWNTNPETYHFTITQGDFFRFRFICLPSPRRALGIIAPIPQNRARIYLIKSDNSLVQVYGDLALTSQVSFESEYTRDLPAGEYIGFRIEYTWAENVFCELRDWLTITVS